MPRLLAPLVLLCAACGGRTAVDATVVDAGDEPAPIDATARDASAPDAGAPDAGMGAGGTVIDAEGMEETGVGKTCVQYGVDTSSNPYPGACPLDAGWMTVMVCDPGTVIAPNSGCEPLPEPWTWCCP